MHTGYLSGPWEYTQGSLQICSLGHIKVHMWQCVQGES